MNWDSIKRALWIRWTKMTGAYQAYDKGRMRAYIDRRDLCQNLNQLESNVTEFRQGVKLKIKNIDAMIVRVRERMYELMEDKLRVQRESLMDARQENQRLREEVLELTDKVDLMAKRLARAEKPAVKKIGG